MTAYLEGQPGTTPREAHSLLEARPQMGGTAEGPRHGWRGEGRGRHRVGFVFGTRPEAIKLAPVILACREAPGLDAVVCVTAQHRELLDHVLGFFGIRPDADLDLMEQGQTLSGFAARAMESVSGWLDGQDLDLLVVQGDTTTTFMAALAAFHRRIRVAHVEAGLRTHARYEPFPEEINRRMVATLADLHFAPTDQAAQNLLAEGVEPRSIHMTGNTVVDAVLRVREMIGPGLLPSSIPDEQGRLIITLTMHRRENFGEPMRQVCRGVADVVRRHPEVMLVVPAHPNPHVRPVLWEELGSLDRVWIIEPPLYPSFIALLMRSSIVLTDSGGVQEEAPILGKPTLVLRDVTERPEGVAAGAATVVGCDRSRVVAETERLLSDPAHYARMAKARSPYGDGQSSARITEILQNTLAAGQRAAVRSLVHPRVAS